ncbi:MAG: cytochrome C biogenesis protein CcmF [Gammaproteobacteria bacterium]|mgnify:FL=1|jgi:cytochrome c-type biogenesis protein CcmF|nr:cytochrome C biogenesis protein CcmF [Gammaproteobacteria bacterium]|tara:strand:- start:46630 stop:48525 length:1896 start_codon:yes stop_codon:yes gene_type:complete
MIIEISHFLSVLAAGLFFLVGYFALFTSSLNTAYLSNLISRTYSHGFLFLICSFIIYVWLAITDNFSVQYIANHSNTALPTFYKISSIWSAHEGSMFLWIVFLSLWGFIFNVTVKNEEILKAKSIGIISFVIVGFLLFLLATSNPFATILPIAPLNGADINPVLQDPALAIHPPTLYLGYVGFVIPFACAISFLLEGKTSIKWEVLARKWSIAAWVFLTVGITLGSWWAYYELGWGGYWFWDPVENVALMPWLAATAFVHSLSVSIKSSQLRVWTILLSILVFSLSLFGAFIVRSGIIDSVHSFANDPERGLYLLAFIGIIIFISISLFVLRISSIQSKLTIKKFSKQSFISLNNIIFGALIFSVMLGVTYPLIYEYLFDQKISIGAPFYNAIFIPIVILASFFLFFSVDSKWSRNSSFSFLKKPIFLSLILSITSTLFVMIFFSTKNIPILLSVFAGLLIIYRYIYEIINYFLYKKFINPFSVIAHMSLGLLIVSISFNSLLSSERAINIYINEYEEYKDLKILFQDLGVEEKSNYDSIKAKFLVEDIKGNKFNLNPEKRKYFTRGQITTETAIHVTPLRDIYMTIGDQLDDGSWIVNIQINYLIRWIWISALLMGLAGIMLIFSKKLRA